VNFDDLFGLKEKVSIVTGGSAGIGLMMARGLAEAGSNVVICSRKLEKCEEAAHEIAQLGVRALPFRCDITKSEEIDNLVQGVLKEFNKVDVLVNNSGRTWGDSPEDISVENWKKVIDLNINGTFFMTQKVGRVMIAQESGNIINIASYAGLRGVDPRIINAIPYSTSKGALIAFTKDLATKWAKYNIRVNCIAPGWFPTKMTKWTLENLGENIMDKLLIKRFGVSEDIVGVTIFLASRASAYMTGQVICVDGGLTVW